MSRNFAKYWLPVLAWAGVIFSLSMIPVTPSYRFDFTDFVIKKTAHFVEYAVFFILVYRALRNSGVPVQKIGFFAMLIIVLYAASDEFHQSFTPGREPSVRDVLIDTSGASFAWFGLWRLLPKTPPKLKELAENLDII